MNIALIIAAWRRRHIAKVCYQGVQRITKEAEQYGIQITTLVATSNHLDTLLAMEHGFHPVSGPNKPLGAKHNKLINAAAFCKPDYFMQLGSDDLLRVGFWQTGILDYLRSNTAVAGFNRLAVYCTTTKRAKVGGYLAGFGAGRFIRADILDKLGGKLWDDNINKGLDYNAQRKITALLGMHEGRMRIVSTPPTAPPAVIDLKSYNNIRTYDDMIGDAVEIDSLVPLFPEIQELM